MVTKINSKAIEGVKLLSNDDFSEFSEYVEDTLNLLVNDPDSLSVKVGYEEANDGRPLDSILVEISGPKSEIAMIVGRGAETARALHRVFFSVARRMGFKGTVRLAWTPEEAAPAAALSAA